MPQNRNQNVSTASSNQSSFPTTPPSTATTSHTFSNTPDRPPRLWSSNPHLTAYNNSSHQQPPYSNYYSSSMEQMDYSPYHNNNNSANSNNRTSFTQVQIDPAFEQSELLGLDMSEIKLKTLPMGIFAFNSLFELKLNGNMLSRLPTQIGQLKSLVLLDLSDNGLVILPREIGKLVNLQELLLYNNQLATLPAEMGCLYQLEHLGLDGNPLQEPFLSLMHSQGPISIITYLREHVQNISSPPDRQWHSITESPQGITKLLTQLIVPLNNTFTMMSYNILAEKYATSQMYGYVASWYLSWEVRKQVIIHEILSYDPDIICLQEVEASQFEQYFKLQLRMRGNYDGVFAPKSRAKTMNEWDRNFVDGCAIFFKMDRFRLVEQHLIEFNQLALARPLLRKHKDMYNRVMTRDNIALVARLQMLLGPASWTELLVANVHIHWDPTFRDVKLVQTIMLTEELERIIASIHAGMGKLPNLKRKEIGVIVCGDFNSLPNSGVSAFLSNGGIGPKHQDFQSHTYEPYSNEGAKNSLNLRSAYSLVSNRLGFTTPSKSKKNISLDDDVNSYEDGEEEDIVDPLMPFTNLTPGFQGCIDYIYYGSEGPLVVTGALGGVSNEYIKQLVGLPSPHFPSDHISLLVEFKVDEGSAREIINSPTPGSSNSSNIVSNSKVLGHLNKNKPPNIKT